jgi:hypothetical protein
MSVADVRVSGRIAGGFGGGGEVSLSAVKVVMGVGGW